MTMHWKLEKPKVSYPVSQYIDSCLNMSRASSPAALMDPAVRSRRESISSGVKWMGMGLRRARGQ